MFCDQQNFGKQPKILFDIFENIHGFGAFDNEHDDPLNIDGITNNFKEIRYHTFMKYNKKFHFTIHKMYGISIWVHRAHVPYPTNEIALKQQIWVNDRQSDKHIVEIEQ